MHRRGGRTGSVYSPHAHLLENNLAFEVLETVYTLIPAGTRRGPALDEPRTASPAMIEYQQWVHRRLRETGLAKALAGGPDFLPDITVELPLVWRVLARLSTPRNYTRLTAQVLHNLAWYLGEDAPPVTLAHKLYRSFWPAIVLTLLLLLTLVMTTGLGRQDWPVITLFGMGLLTIMLSSVWIFGLECSGRFKANCAEMYEYLLEAYAEPGPASENQVQSLLIELGRETDISNAALQRRARGSSGMRILE